MKKLNKKGFTLIELLAVIVILAIIVVVTVPTVLNSIEDARRSSLDSLAEEIANWYDTSYANDQLGLGEKILGDAHLDHSTGSTGAICLGALKNGDKSLAEIYGLSGNDFLLEKTTVILQEGTPNITSSVCSFIKLKDGKAQVVLFGNENGKFGTMISKRFAHYNTYKSYIKKA